MTPAQWHQAKSIFERALDVTPDRQAAFLDTACGGDENLRAVVAGMLEADAEPPSLFDAAHADLASLVDVAGPLPEHIGPYRILRLLGHGGMGVVFLAERTDLPKQVALKLLRDRWAAPEVMQRFQREQAVLARLQHPHIAQLLDAGTTKDGMPYFAMEYVEGEPLTTFCDARRYGIKDRLRLFSAVCEAVQYAHRNLVIHRDLKPGNILVAPGAEAKVDGEVIKLLDFGIAKLVETETDLALTQTGFRAMTPAYASPEQIQGLPVTTSSDVYSLGVVLYELLTGHRPYYAQHATDWERLIQEADPSKPSTAVSRPQTRPLPDGSTETRTPAQVSQARNTGPAQLKSLLRGDLDNIVMKALRKAPDQRYASAEALLADVQRYLKGFPVDAHRGTLGYRAGKFIKRHTLGVGVTAAGAVLVLGFAGLMTWQQSVTAQERDRARLEAEKANKVADFMFEFFRATFPEDLSTDTLTAGDLLGLGLETVEEQLSDQPEVQAHMLDIIGRVYQARGAYDQAHDLLQRALALRRAVYEAPHPEIAVGLNSLGFHYVLRTAYDKALPLHEEALAMRRAVFGNDHPDVALSLNNIAHIANVKGDYETTLRLLNESLAIRRKHLGDEHPDIAQSIGNLAVVYGNTGDLQKAEALTREALALRIKLYSEDHFDVVFTKRNLAHYLRKQGRLDEALPMAQAVVNDLVNLLGEEHAQVGTARYNLGVLLHDMGQTAEAEAQLLAALPLLEALAPDHTHVITIHRMLGDWRMASGRMPEAALHYETSLRHARSRYGEDDWHTGVAKSALGAYYTETGDFTRAAGYLQEAHATLTATRGPDDPNTLRTQARLDTLAQRRHPAALFP